MNIYQDSTKTARERAENLLSLLTLDEKLGQLNMVNEAIPRLNIPTYHWWNEALHGVARNGKATMFPQAIAVAATFTPDYARQMGKVIQEEAWIKHRYAAAHGEHGIYAGLTMYSPNINIFRDPRWGRGHETYGECPVLTSLMGTAFVQGVEGEDPEHLKCSTTLKHFAAHSGPEGVRGGFDSKVSRQDLAQTYLYAFKYCLKHSRSKSFMTAYNAINGTPMSANKEIIQDMLRDEWGFDGVTVTDVGTAAFLVAAHKRCKDIPEALAMEISAGVDVCCEVDDQAHEHFREAYDRGLLKEEDIDRAVRNQLILKFQLGMFDSHELPDYTRLECREFREISRKISERSMVLLKNDGILPLNPEKLNRVAVIGPTATDIEVLRGNYAGTASRYVTLLQGLQDTFGEDKIIYALGSEIIGDRTEVAALPNDRLAEAVSSAENSDLIVLCMGLTPEFEGEAGSKFAEAQGDKLRLEYSDQQKVLLEKLYATGKPMILLSCSGSAMAMPAERMNAVIQVFYPGPEGGRVAADILTGKVNPSGRLPLTFYKSTDCLPDFTDYSMRGRTYRYTDKNILFPFGYGLSYTTFEYSELTAPAENSSAEGIPCQIKVKNSGDRAGETVVLFYFKHEDGADWEPLKQFAGSVRIALEPGETKDVTFTYPAEFLEFADEEGFFHPVTGKITLMIEDQRLTIDRK
ncbi:MAG: glycoside hydrolase family 3 C-terminal domain-containing protein [Lentisphaeria bacterium]|nr:glycoside hydrolase family 3 C-terminal domain-containing protein [Lentisphaeria bacterium]